MLLILLGVVKNMNTFVNTKNYIALEGIPIHLVLIDLIEQEE